VFPDRIATFKHRSKCTIRYLIDIIFIAGINTIKFPAIENPYWQTFLKNVVITILDITICQQIFRQRSYLIPIQTDIQIATPPYFPNQVSAGEKKFSSSILDTTDILRNVAKTGRVRNGYIIQQIFRVFQIYV